MKKNNFKYLLILVVSLTISSCKLSEKQVVITDPTHQVTLKEAHIGNLDIDSMLMDSYSPPEEELRQFYLAARQILSRKPGTPLSDPGILDAAREQGIALMGGPMLGRLSAHGVSLWLRPASSETIYVKLKESGRFGAKSYALEQPEAGVEQRILLDGLEPAKDYRYELFVGKRSVVEGSFRTAPKDNDEGEFRLAFGSCFHKIGLHNPNLIGQILSREPGAVMLLGDIAVDDRENQIQMHSADYLLRDISGPWRDLAAHIPLYAAWDDHDYLNNDLSGIPEGFSAADRDALRLIWGQNWNNPENKADGIYFNTRVGPVEIIMLDTRSCRRVAERGNYGSYLGEQQMTWLKETLAASRAPFKLISSGTMWSDDISNGKDSWGTWDTLAREELFTLVEEEGIQGVLLISGDRHGARGFRIPRNENNALYEFEAASLGGVPGPEAIAKDHGNQLFGYKGEGFRAFGEFTFVTGANEPRVEFRLIDEGGNILEHYFLSYDQLSPGIPENLKRD